MNGGTWFDKMQAVDRRIIYLILLVVCATSVFIPASIPVKPDTSSADLFHYLMTTPTDKPIMIESDWTLSTRGENSASMEALIRILMRRKVKFILFCGGDPQAIQVARDVLRRINQERVASGEPAYRQWVDYIDLGVIPDMGSMANAMSTDFRTALKGMKNVNEQGVPEAVLSSPVFNGVNAIEDMPLLINVTASATIDMLVQRLSPGKKLIPGEKMKGKIPLACMCTGVMGPQALPYSQAGQVVGLGIGLKGAYDMEYMMEHGLNSPDASGTVVEYRADPTPIRAFPGAINFDRANRYYLTLHAALGLLILFVIVGNVGYYASKKSSRRAR